MAYITMQVGFPVNSGWRGISWSPSLGIFIATNDTTSYYTSKDGVIWTPHTISNLTAGYYLSEIKWGHCTAGDYFIIIAVNNVQIYSGSIVSTNFISMKSLDGVTWSNPTTVNTFTGPKGYYSMGCNGINFLLKVYQSSNTYMLYYATTDGDVWTYIGAINQESQSSYMLTPPICWDGSYYYARQLYSPVATYRSTTGTGWVTIGASGDSWTGSSYFSNGELLIQSNSYWPSSPIYVSDNHGISWTQYIPPVVFYGTGIWDGTSFIHASGTASYPGIYHSTNGQSWTSLSTPVNYGGRMANNGTVTVMLPSYGGSAGLVIGSTLDPPVALPATNITKTGFTANWE